MATPWANDRAFSVAEVAGLIETPEDTVRGWIYSGAAPYASAKRGHRRLLSANDAYILAITKRLIAAGYETMTATAEAWLVTGPDADVTDMPADLVLVAVPGGAGLGSVAVARMADATSLIAAAGSIIIPAGQIAASLAIHARSLYHGGPLPTARQRAAADTAALGMAFYQTGQRLKGAAR